MATSGIRAPIRFISARIGLGVTIPYADRARWAATTSSTTIRSTPNTQVATFEFQQDGKKKLLVFEVRHWMTNDEAGIGERSAGQAQAIGNIWYGSTGYMANTNEG